MEKTIDPVCGMTVLPETAAGEFEYSATKYYFCSKGCLEKFMADPDAFLRPKTSSDAHKDASGGHHGEMKNHYVRFLLMIILMFITMYLLMYAMVGSHSNVNQFQMTVLMTAPMVVIEIILMNELYRNKRLNRTIVVLSLVFTIGCWFLIREQTTIFEALFGNSETTPHSGASLVNHESADTNSEIEKLCGETVRTQAQEIQQLKDTLNRIERSH